MHSFARFYYVKAWQINVNNALAESMIFAVEKTIETERKNKNARKINSYIELASKAEKK